MNKDAHVNVTSDLPYIIQNAVKTEMQQWRDLPGEDKEKANDLITLLIEEKIVYSLSLDKPEKAEFHRRNIAHYEAALTHIQGISQIKLYQSVINIIGRVLADILLATGKALI